MSSLPADGSPSDFSQRINRALELSTFARRIILLAATDRISAWRKIDTSLAGGSSEFAEAVLVMIEHDNQDEALAAGIAVAKEKGWPARLRRRLS